MGVEEFDCVTCGACCVSTWDSETYVYVGDDDVRQLRLAYDEDEVARIVGGLDDPMEQGLKTKVNCQGHVTCIVLDGKVGERCSCSIYEHRPETCIDFKPGGDCCKLAREEAGIPKPS